MRHCKWIADFTPVDSLLCCHCIWRQSQTAWHCWSICWKFLIGIFVSKFYWFLVTIGLEWCAAAMSYSLLMIITRRAALATISSNSISSWKNKPTKSLWVTGLLEIQVLGACLLGLWVSPLLGALALCMIFGLCNNAYKHLLWSHIY